MVRDHGHVHALEQAAMAATTARPPSAPPWPTVEQSHTRRRKSRGINKNHESTSAGHGRAGGLYLQLRGHFTHPEADGVTDFGITTPATTPSAKPPPANRQPLH